MRGGHELVATSPYGSCVDLSAMSEASTISQEIERGLKKKNKARKKARKGRKKRRKKNKKKKKKGNKKADPFNDIYQFAKGLSGRRKVKNIFSPQFAAMHWLQEEQAAYNTTWDEDELTRRYVLASLYFSSNGPQWETTNGADINWLDPGPVCETWGDKVDCERDYEDVDDSEVLVGLELDSLGMQGALVDELGFLPSLTLLDLHNNSLQGSIPYSLGLLTDLEYLDLGSNFFEGKIPSTIGTLTYLVYLGLNDNELSGKFPRSFEGLENVEDVFMQSNQLQGSIPSQIAGMSNLVQLDLSGNNLTGSIPEELGTATQLSFLSLAQNAFTGTISESLASKLVYMTILQLHDNQFSGSMPEAFCEAPPSWLDLHEITADCSCDDEPRIHCPCCSNCQLDRDEIYDLVSSMSDSSTFDDVCSPQHITASWLQEEKAHYGLEWGDYELTQRYAMGVLYHSMNGPSWKTQADFFKTTKVCDWGNDDFRVLCDSERKILTYLYWVGKNDMPSATLPAEIFYLIEMGAMVLTNNNLQGTIPSEISKATGLKHFWLNGNQLSGTVPTEIGLMTNLESLAWFGNQLTGTLPTEIGYLENLDSCYLGTNELTGTIPTEVADMAKLTVFTLQNNFHNGTIPTVLPPLLTQLDLGNNDLTGSVPSELGSLSALTNLYIGKNDLTGSIPDVFCTDAFDFTYLRADCGGSDPKVTCNCCLYCDSS